MRPVSLRQKHFSFLLYWSIKFGNISQSSESVFDTFPFSHPDWIVMVRRNRNISVKPVKIILELIPHIPVPSHGMGIYIYMYIYDEEWDVIYVIRDVFCVKMQLLSNVTRLHRNYFVITIVLIFYGENNFTLRPVQIMDGPFNSWINYSGYWLGQCGKALHSIQYWDCIIIQLAYLNPLWSSMPLMDLSYSWTHCRINDISMKWWGKIKEYKRNVYIGWNHSWSHDVFIVQWNEI